MSDISKSEDPVKQEDLPPPRKGAKGINLRPISPPLWNVSFRQFNYYLALAGVLILAVYTWRLMLWKTDAGGWWNLALGRRPPINQMPSPGEWNGVGDAGRGDVTIEDRINQLASALGMPSKDLAAAIAAAVHECVPPATLSSISASQTGDALQYLVDPESASKFDTSSTAITPAITRGMGNIAKAFDAVVGSDEPTVEME